MSGYDSYDSPREYRRYVKEERGDPRYRETRESYVAHPSSRDLIPRTREDSELSVEEVHRDFPPPGYGSRRSRDPGYDDYYDDDYRRGYGRESERGHKKGTGSAYYEEEKSRRRVLSKQEQIVAAVAGAALALGGKEAYDRYEAKEHGGTVKRNALASAALAAAGGLAGYQGAEFYNKHATKEEKKGTYIVHRGRDGKITEYYSDDDSDSKEKKGHKNFLEGALGAAGLGGAIKALTGGGSDDEKRSTRSRRGSDGSRSRSRSRGKGDTVQKVQKAAMAALIAGATEAFRVRKEPGSWSGEKTKRILTAAAGAGAIDTAQDGEKHGKLSTLESVVGGLLGNRLIHGSRSNLEEDPKTGRSRSRSRARSSGGGAGGASGIAALTAGLGAALGAKKLADRSRSQSRSRRRSADSYGSRSPDRRRSRSRSVVGRSLAKLGIGSEPDDRDRDRRRRRDDDYDDGQSSRRGGSRRGGGDDDDYEYPRGQGRREDYEDDRSYKSSGRRRGDRDRDRRRDEGSSDSDLGDSDEDEKRAKKMRGKQILTTGLAAVATIHAAHEVYQSVEKRQARKKAVKEGRLSPEEAKKLKTKAMLQDAASVGIAALGIKGAISELKEAKEMNHECKEWQEEKARRHARRLERMRRMRSRSTGGGPRSSNDSYYGRRRSDGYASSVPPRPDRWDAYPSRYYDGNPYAALPAPPVGYGR